MCEGRRERHQRGGRVSWWLEQRVLILGRIRGGCQGNEGAMACKGAHGGARGGLGEVGGGSMREGRWERCQRGRRGNGDKDEGGGCCVGVVATAREMRG